MDNLIYTQTNYMTYLTASFLTFLFFVQNDLLDLIKLYFFNFSFLSFSLPIH